MIKRRMILDAAGQRRLQLREVRVSCWVVRLQQMKLSTGTTAVLANGEQKKVKFC